MSSPKIIRVHKSPRNNSGKHQDPKPFSKKCQKSKQPIQREKQKKHKEDLKYRYEQMLSKCKYLQAELSKQRLKNQALEKQLFTALEQVQKYKRKQQRSPRQEVYIDNEKQCCSAKIVSFCVEDKRTSTNCKEQRNFQKSKTTSEFLPETPKQKIQVGGYFGSLFN